jgi:glutathione synthase/RimK-type ligase-like ATP-grasp enzyme
MPIRNERLALPKIAFLACPGTLPGSPARRFDAFEHDNQIAALRDGLGNRAEVVDLDWRAPLDVLAQFDAALIGTAWDYTAAKDEFLARLEALEAAGVAVCNASEVVRWNADKLYLRDLAQRGAPSIPTLWPENPGRVEVVAALEQFGCDKVVVKRRVGSGADGQEWFSRSILPDADWQLGQAGMIQPFLSAIQGEGELSFIFVGGALSHALTKQAQPGEYRIQSNFGGIETKIEPTLADLAAALQVMALLPFPESPLYARIDMVRLDNGALAVIEAELIEPYLYPLQGPVFGKMLADAVLETLAKHG